jgi:hypothetical protein
MEFNIVFNNGKPIAIVESKQMINNAQEALELLVNCMTRGTNKVVMRDNNLNKDFFDLKTGVAGEVLQKFSTYDGYLAIVGNFDHYTGRSLHDFIYESNKQKRINFVSDLEEAIEILSK